ncbi:DUF167 domain-containing protein [Skermanella sp. TT6]|uniref:UPF0235 protein IGS68_25230 n=1 Tax=Skermanella cutis TaxID=2775420 RepID=A0ABX7B551_9PROT|nr:DUF167 family protein [Skermanella sp. TT6]QQP89254.1 DUF167 domain-containing protein [Skermanella sp. TT6]
MPFRPAAGGVTVAVRLTPRASRNAVVGIGTGTGPAGREQAVLKVMVTAVPDSGRANEALVRLLAKQWKVPGSAITLVAGATDRNKILHVAGDPADLMTRLTTLSVPTDPSGSSKP